MGSHLAAEFLKEGHRLIILARKDIDRSADQKVYEELKPFFDNTEDYDSHFKTNVKVVEGDVSDSNLGLTEDSISNISEVDEVVHLAASLSFKEKDRDKTIHTNVDGTVNVLDFAKSKKAKKVNFISTAYVCGKNEGVIKENLISDSEKPEFNNPYEESKYIAEQKIKDWSLKNKIPANIFRPSIIVEKWDTDSGFGYYAFAKCFALMRREVILNDEKIKFPGDSDTQLNLIEIDDIVDSISKIMANEDKDKEVKVFHLTNPNAPTLGEVFDDTLKVIGLGRKIELINNKEYADHDSYNNFSKQKITREMVKMLRDLIPYLFLKTEFEVENTKEALGGGYNPERASDFLEDVLKHRYSPDAENDFVRNWESKRPIEIIPKEYRHKEIEISKFRQKAIDIALNVFEKGIKLFFRPSGIEDVRKLYSVEAKNYDSRHHLTTAYNDTKLRKETAHMLKEYAGKFPIDYNFRVLDIATGTGLTLEEINKTMAKMDLFGIDFTEAMLDKGRKRMLKENNHLELSLKKGDATNFIDREEGYAKDGFYKFKPNSIDCITNIFGIGGINNSNRCFEEQLKVLKEGGISIMIDMHAPSLEEKDIHMPLGLPISPSFIQQAWEKITKPIVLKNLWGWNDPTENFYNMPLAVCFDEQKNKYFGFDLIKREVENMKWWLGLPLMPVAKEVVKKVEISKSEFLIKQSIVKNKKT